MRAVLQRVKEASVTVDDDITGKIGQGILLLLGISDTDTDNEIDQILDKTLKLRIFNDSDGKMNLSLEDVEGGLLIVSQFTLYADTRKGRRPSYIKAARPDVAEAIYNKFVAEAGTKCDNVATDRFGAMMDVRLLNDGPVTIILDTDEKR